MSKTDVVCLFLPTSLRSACDCSNFSFQHVSSCSTLLCSRCKIPSCAPNTNTITITALLLTYCHCHTFWFLKSQTRRHKQLTVSASTFLYVSQSFCRTFWAASASFNFSAKACPKKTNLEVFWNVYALTWFIKYWNWFIRQCFCTWASPAPDAGAELSLTDVSKFCSHCWWFCTIRMYIHIRGLCKHAQMWILIQFIRMGRWNKWSVLCLHTFVSCFCFAWMCVCIVHLVSGQWRMRQESVQQCSAFGLRWLQHCLMLLWKNRSNTPIKRLKRCSNYIS